MISIFITNLGKYNEGELVGKWITLPMEIENIESELKFIGINDEYEEWFLSDYESNHINAHEIVGEYSNIFELNFLAEKLEDMEPYEIDIFNAVVEHGGNNDIAFYINLCNNLDNYSLFDGVTRHDELAHYVIDNNDFLSIPESLEYCIDYDAIGRDYDINANGSFTEKGYLEESNEPMEIYYVDIDDLPYFDDKNQDYIM